MTFKAPVSAVSFSSTSTQLPPICLPVVAGTHTMCFPVFAGALACDADTGFSCAVGAGKFNRKREFMHSVENIFALNFDCAAPRDGDSAVLIMESRAVPLTVNESRIL